MDEQDRNTRRRWFRVGLAVVVSLAVLVGIAGSGHAAPGGASAARRQQTETAAASRAMSGAVSGAAVVGDGRSHASVIAGAVTPDGVWWWLVRTVRVVGPWGVPDVMVVTVTLIWWGGPSCPRTYTVATDGTHTATGAGGPGCTASDARAHVMVEAVTNRTATGAGMDAGDLADLVPTVVPGVPAVASPGASAAVACPGVEALCQKGSPAGVTPGRVPVAHWPTGVHTGTGPVAGVSLSPNLSDKPSRVEV